MKTAFITLISSLLAPSVFASAPLYYYNGPGITVTVNSDGSARITESCGGVSIPNGWNIEGRPMSGEQFSGLMIQPNRGTAVQVSAQQSRSSQNAIRLRVSGQTRPLILQKSDRPATFMICL